MDWQYTGNIVKKLHLPVANTPCVSCYIYKSLNEYKLVTWLYIRD